MSSDNKLRELARKMGNKGYCNYKACEEYLRQAAYLTRMADAELAKGQPWLLDYEGETLPFEQVLRRLAEKERRERER